MAVIAFKMNSTSFCDSYGSFNNFTHLNPNLRSLAIFELSPSQAAFSIDHVLESIFSGLDTLSLKSCRLVSSRWKEFGAIELQKRVTIRLDFIFESFGDAFSNGDQAVISYCYPIIRSPSPSSSSCPLTSLLSLIELSTNFPCDTFDISTETLGSQQLQKVLCTIGPWMRRLKLSLVLYLQRSSLAENSVFADLKTLLSVQAPYLDSFDLKVELPIHWKEESMRNNNKFSEFNSFFNVTSLPNLKSISFRDPLPHQFLSEILTSATNLRKFHGSHGGAYFTEHHGKNRIHLLKHLHFAMSNESQAETVSQLLRQNRNNLKLESIRITVSKSFLEDDFSTIRSQRHPRSSVHILNELLEASGKTLQKLTMEPLRSLPGIRIPQMPKLQSLVLVTRSADSVFSSFPEHFFPPAAGPGFSVSSALPALSSITVLSHFFDSNFDGDVRRLLEVPEPLTAVSFLRVLVPKRISSETLQILRKTLPNSVLAEMTDEDRIEREALVELNIFP